MNSNIPTSRALRVLANTAKEPRAAYELQEEEREAEQGRICIWEELHRVHLPLQSGHQLVHVISTELSVQQVELEQERRTLLRSQTPR